ncbi:hypothetical protein ACFSYD_12020 [Paracoccus aerius]
MFYDGASYWLADGFHRYKAFAQINAHDVPADVRQGTQRAAILFSVGANASHGLRRTNDDKRRAVMVLLNDPEWSKWSDREIARQAGVSNRYVSNLRAGTVTVNVHTEPRTYTDRHGNQATMNTANIGGGGKVASPPVAEQNKGETAFGVEVDSGASLLGEAEAELEQAEAVDSPEVAKQRRELAKLTTEALIDEVIGLGADLRDAKAEVNRQKSEIDTLNEKLREATASDLGAAVGRLQRRLDQANFARNEAMKTAKREEYKRKQAEKRVAELENAGVVVLGQ